MTSSSRFALRVLAALTCATISVVSLGLTTPAGAAVPAAARAAAARSTVANSPVFGYDPVIGIAARNPEDAWLVTVTGSVEATGYATSYGDLRHATLARPIVGIAATRSSKGYWIVASDGGVFSFGDAHFYGSTGAIHLNRAIVGMAATPSGRGYWMVASDGGIFSFGDARFFGSTGAIHLNRSIVGMAATPSGRGYWLVASDGGIFSFGDARFFGSTGGIHLSRPIVGIAATRSGRGYWLVAADGGVFVFGDAHFYGSAVGKLSLSGVIGTAAGIARTSDGAGYWIAGAGAFGVNAPVGMLPPLFGFGSAATPQFTHVYEAFAGPCLIDARGNGRATYNVTYTNGEKQTRTFVWPFEPDDPGRSVYVAGYRLMWEFGVAPRWCEPDVIQIKHLLAPGKSAQYVFSGSCGTWAHGWTVYYSVDYTDHTYKNSQMQFDTDSVPHDSGTMYVDFGNDLTVSKNWSTYTCGLF